MKHPPGWTTGRGRKARYQRGDLVEVRPTRRTQAKRSAVIIYESRARKDLWLIHYIGGGAAWLPAHRLQPIYPSTPTQHRL